MFVPPRAMRALLVVLLRIHIGVAVDGLITLRGGTGVVFPNGVRQRARRARVVKIVPLRVLEFIIIHKTRIPRTPAYGACSSACIAATWFLKASRPRFVSR